MDKMSAQDSTGETAQTTGWLSGLAWVAALTLWAAIASSVYGRIGPVDAQNLAFGPLAQSIGVALIESMALIGIALAVTDFALLFGRCASGEVFSARNVETLRSGGGSLVFAALASAILTPNLLDWINHDFGGLRVVSSDLALGAGAMGLVIIGLAHVFRDALRIKSENDAMV